MGMCPIKTRRKLMTKRNLSDRTIALIMTVVMIALMPVIPANEALASDYGIPGEIIGEWEYVGSNQPESANQVWVRGNGYGVSAQDDGKEYFNSFSAGLINTTSANYKLAYDTLMSDNKLYDYIRDVRICILYLPECPYSKSYLPKFQQIAAAAGAPVLLIDVSKYSASLITYYNSVMFGVTAPTVLYLDANETAAATGRALPRGESKVHRTADFVRILKAAGYENAQDLPDGNGSNGYSVEQEYERKALMETNRYRIENNLLPLSTFPELEEAADIRAEELLENMAHQRPDGTNYHTVFNETGLDISRYYTGENICAGGAVSLPGSAVRAWMNSPGHRANILNENYSHMSVGYKYQNSDPSKYMDNWIQLFMGKCIPDRIELDRPSVKTSIQGVPISDMDINLVLTCAHGTSTIPLIDEMCTGYDSSAAGLQTVKVHYGDTALPLEINVGDVAPHELTEDMVTITDDIDNIIYNGRAHTPAVRVSNSTGDYALIENYSYETAYEDNVNTGMAKITVTGKGNYTGTVTKTFEIKPKDIADMTVSGIDETYEYTGKPITPNVILTDGSRVLHENIDFTVEYADNVGEEVKGTNGPDGVTGTAVVTVKGMGNYTGEAVRNFGFTLPLIYKNAARIGYVFNNPYYSSTYEYLTTIKTKNPTAYEMVIKQMENCLAAVDADKDKGAGIEDVMAYSLYPAANRHLNDYYRFRAEVDGGLNIEGIKKEPEVASEKINADSINIDGLGNLDMVTEETESVQLAVADTDKDALNIDTSAYDTVSAVALDISLKIDGSEVNDLNSPVTVTVSLPEVFSMDDNLAVLHYEDGADSAPKELSVFKNVQDSTISFVTKSFSPYVIAKKVEVYNSGQASAPAVNDESQTGVSFGTENDAGPSAPQDVFASHSGENEITVSWTAVQDNDVWKVTGYKIAYSLSENMSGAEMMEINDPAASKAVLTGLGEGVYYITVSTLADSDATRQVERSSVTVRAEVHEEAPEEDTPASTPTAEPPEISDGYDWTLSVSGGSTVIINALSEAPEGHKLSVFAVKYDENGALTGCEVKYIVTEAGMDEYTAEFDQVFEKNQKFFLWDSDMQPLSLVFENI